MPSYCTSCGYKNEDDSAFCESCGAAIARAPSRAEQAATPQALGPVATAKRRRRLYVTLVLLACTAGIVAVEYALPSHPLSAGLTRLGLPSLFGGADAGVLYLVGSKGRYGYVDRNGAEVIAFSYEQPPLLAMGTVKFPQLFQRSIAPFPVHSKGGWILLDRRGKQIGNVKLNFLSAPSDDPAASCISGGIGDRRVCIDATGNDLLGSGFDMPPKGVRLHRILEGNQWGLADETGKVIVQPTYSLLFPFRANATTTLARFDDGKFGLLDLQGKESSRRRYAEANEPKDGIWPVKVDRNWALADLNGEVIAQLAPAIREVGYFSEGLARASTATGEGLIDKAGKWVVGPRKWLSGIRDFAEGRAAVGPLGNVGVIGIDGEFIIPPVLGDMAQFAGGAAVASVGEDTWLVSASGRVLWPREMEHAAGAQQGKAGVLASRWQLVNGNKSDLGSEWEFSDTKARITLNGSESEFKVRFTDGSPNRITLNGRERRYWLFADTLASSDNNGGVIVFRRMGNAGPPPEVQKAKSTANETIGGMISKILPLGGGSSGNSPIGKWRNTDAEFEFFEDGTLAYKELSGAMSGGTFTGKWIKLSDGRLKVDLQLLGIPAPPLLGGIESGELILQGELGRFQVARVN